MYFGKLAWLAEVNPPETFFVMRLHRLGVITWEDKDVELAKFYGIPKCCRNFYINLRWARISPSYFMDKMCGPDTERAYVRCPKCRFGKGVIKL
jgi:hypothetical protein